jgi:hypothetical protein
MAVIFKIFGFLFHPITPSPYLPICLFTTDTNHESRLPAEVGVPDEGRDTFL